MAITKFYFDEMMSRTAAEQFVARGYEIVMAVDVGMVKKDDMTDHLPYATERGLVVATFDRPFAGKASEQADHAGLVCLSGSQDDIGNIVLSLTKFAEERTADEVKGRVFWL